MDVMSKLMVTEHGVNEIQNIHRKEFGNNLNKKDIRPRNLKTKEPNQHNKLDSGFK